MPHTTGTQFAGPKLHSEFVKNSLKSILKCVKCMILCVFLRSSKYVTFTYTAQCTKLDSTLSNCFFNLSRQISSLFVLQYVINVFFLTFTVSNCGQHWHTYKSGCLRLFEDRKDWVAANQHCATFSTCSGGNGRLISIFSPVDNDEIGNFTSSLACPQGMVSHSYFRV